MAIKLMFWETPAHSRTTRQLVWLLLASVNDLQMDRTLRHRRDGFRWDVPY